MLGTDKSRGYCLEMICADFLAGASLEGSNPDLLLHSQLRLFKFLDQERRESFIAEVTSSSRAVSQRPAESQPTGSLIVWSHTPAVYSL